MSDLREAVRAFLWSDGQERADTLAALMKAYDESAAQTPAADAGLRDVILNGGLKLPGFDHWRARATSKPSDPDDVRWECSCGYAGSPESVQRHWRAIEAEALR